MSENLKQYIVLVDFLAEILGENSEVVLHDIKNRDLGASVLYIRNSLTGRKVGSPATDLLLNTMQENQYEDTNYILNYKSKSSDGRTFLSYSLLIKDQTDELTGMICVNRDQTGIDHIGRKIEDILLDFTKLTSFKPKLTNDIEDPVHENLYTTINNIVEDAIIKVTGSKGLNTKILSKPQKLEIVDYLNKNGFFKFKNSVTELASIFGMSEVSIYKYINEVKISNVNGE